MNVLSTIINSDYVNTFFNDIIKKMIFTSSVSKNDAALSS